MDLGLEGRTALITGASSGIGRAIALGLAAEGARTVVTARREERLRELSAEVAARGGTEPVVVVCDFTDHDAPDVVAAAAGPVDILVNNAGGSRAFGLEGTEEDWEEALTLNFTRHRQLTSRLLPGMTGAGWGRIINITGKSEPEGVNGAFAAKAAMHAWAKGLSREVGRHGITVNSIPPGRIMSEQIRRNYSPEYRERQSREEIPVGEYGQPEDIAHLACFLASPLARYITGAVIPVDGGLRRYQF
ncbi:MAG: SDR family oxidoreductase [Streptosporangiales bacterium]|nr:SDR family oxidoreductase [Streptosporangiales bacterium]